MVKRVSQSMRHVFLHSCFQTNCPPSVHPPQPFEMKDGSIVINVRNQNNYHCRCRVVVRSLDGGMSLPIDTLYFDYALVDPVVAAGAMQKDGVLYFTNPANENERT